MLLGEGGREFTCAKIPNTWVPGPLELPRALFACASLRRCMLQHFPNPYQRKLLGYRDAISFESSRSTCRSTWRGQDTLRIWG